VTTDDQNASYRNSEDLAKLHANFGSNGMYSMAGIGVGFRGKTFLSPGDKAAGIALRTRWIIILWIPLIPLGSYRIKMLPRQVTSRGRFARSFQIFSKEALSIKQVLKVYVISAIAVTLVFLAFRFWSEL